MNDMKLELLRKVFWDMNSISYRVERHTKGSGKDKTTVVYLYITISHKTTDEMADQYHFNVDRKSNWQNCWMRSIGRFGVPYFTVSEQVMVKS